VFDRVAGLTPAGLSRSVALGKVQLGHSETVRLTPPAAGPTSFPPEVLLEYMDWAGVEKAVLLQAGFYGDLNTYVHRAVTSWPDRFVGAAHLDPWSDGGPAAFDRAMGDLGFRAVKLEMSETLGLTGLHPGAQLDDEGIAWFWQRSDRLGLVVTLDLGAVGGKAYQTEALAHVADRYPNVKIVVAHLAQPPIGAELPHALDGLWQEQVRVARQSNVWLDLAALPAYGADQDFPYDRARKYIRRAVALVGADRLLWGSDIPGLLLQATYQQLLAYVARYCDFLTADELAGILGRNAMHVYFE
jgi:predicted TIM-barrel fold metal-dependent hydrolase